MILYTPCIYFFYKKTTLNWPGLFFLFMFLSGICATGMAQTKTLPTVALFDISFFKHKEWHDSIFPPDKKQNLRSIKAAVAFARHNHDPVMEAYGLIESSKLLLSEKRYSEAIADINRACQLDTLLPPFSAVRQYLYAETAGFYNEFGTYRLAAQWMQKAIDLDLSRDSLPTHRLFDYYNIFAHLQLLLNNRDSCYFYYRKAISTGKRLGLQPEASAINNFGIVLLTSGKADTAMKLFLQAKEMISRVSQPDSAFIFAINDNIGDVYFFKRQYPQAIASYESKFRFQIRNRKWKQVFNAGVKGANAMLKDGRMNDAVRRMNFLDSLLEKHPESIAYKKREELLNLQLQYAQLQHNQDQVIKVVNKLIALQREINADLSRERLSQLEDMLVETSDRLSKEIEIEKLKYQESISRTRFNRILASASVFTALLIILIGIILYRRRGILNKLEIERQITKTKLAETSLQNEQLEKIRLAQQLELNKAAIEQESYKREIAEINLKNEQLEKIRINQQLALKQRDVTDYALAYVQRKKIFEELIAKIKRIKRSGNSAEELESLVKSLTQQIQGSLPIEKIDSKEIEKINHEFFEKLSNLCPNLTTGEKDLTGLIRINFSAKEISVLRNISPASVRMSKFRLKKKLKLDSDQDLVEFIKKI